MLMQFIYSFLNVEFSSKFSVTSLIRALFPVPGGPLTYVHPPQVFSVQFCTKSVSSLRSSSRPTNRPGSPLRVNNFRAAP